MKEIKKLNTLLLMICLVLLNACVTWAQPLSSQQALQQLVQVLGLNDSLQSMEDHLSPGDQYMMMQNILVSKGVKSVIHLSETGQNIKGSDFVALVKDLVNVKDIKTLQGQSFSSVEALIKDHLAVKDFATFLKSDISTSQFQELMRVLDFVKDSPAAYKAPIVKDTKPSEPSKKSHVVKPWSGHVAVGYMYDDHVNQGTESGTVFVFDSLAGSIAPFNEDFSEKDHARIVDIRLSRVDRLNQNSFWQTDFRASMTDYKDQTDYDSKQLSLSSGPVFVNGKLTLSLPVLTDIVKYGRDADMGEYYSSAFGVAPKLEIQLKDNISLNTSLIFFHRHYAHRTDRDSDTFIWDNYFRATMGKRNYMDVGFTFEDNHAENDSFSYEGAGFYVRYYRELFQNMSFYWDASFRRVMYDTFEGAFTDRRDDEIFRASVTLAYYLECLKSSFSLTYTRIDNQNHLAVYEYNRDQYRVMLTREF